MVSIKEVAVRAAVSVGTVSNVLNRPDVVAAATRRKVEAAIADLGEYCAAQQARARAWARAKFRVRIRVRVGLGSGLGLGLGLGLGSQLLLTS